MNARTQRLTVLTLIAVAVLVVAAIVFVRLTDGGAPSAAIAAGQFELERQPRLGAPDAPVTVVIFEDYSCPACRSFEENVFPRIKRQYVDTGQVQAYALNFQFLGPDSTRAAMAAECARAQSVSLYWEYKTYIYRIQGSQGQTWATTERLVDLARENVPDLDAEELRSCIEENRFEDEIQRDREIGSASGVTGTPSVFVDGRQVSSPSYDDVVAAIEEALAAHR